MTDEERNRVRTLRNRGLSYKQVADEVGLSINTVKTFCRRDNRNPAPETAEGFCRFCGKKLIQAPGARSRKYCSRKCKEKYWTAHRSELAHKITYTCTCAHCGKEFTFYGKRDRKYCSKECYFAERFGEH